jgi:adenylate cyclase
MAVDTNPTPDAVRAQIMRILDSQAFKCSDKQRKFLSFVVDQTLKGRASQIKGYTIAVSVYGRSDEFDPQVDPIVRVEAGRLRRALDRYYITAGSDDPILIAIPKGAYVPTFRVRAETDPVSGSDRRQNERRSTLAMPTIAVMPLINLTGDPTQDYFVDGLTEELTAELARYQEFRVLAAQSSMRFKGKLADPRAVGRQLKVKFLLSGSMRRDTDTVKVTVQLVDTSSGHQIWSKSFKRKLDPASLIDIQEKIALSIVGSVADHYGLISRRLSLESRRKAPDEMKAYDAVLRFYRYETELTSEAFKAALIAIERAVEIEPNYGLAWSMLGHLHADNYALGFCEIDAPLEKALAYAQQGITLSPQNQFASDALSLVYFHLGDKEAFLKHVDQTIALNPNSPYIVGVAGWHMVLYGEWERGLTLLHKGMQLNPYYPSWFHLATFLNAYRLGNYEDAYANAIQFNLPGLYLDPVMRSAALGQMGKTQAARSALDELFELVPDFAARGRQLVGRYVKVEDLIEALFHGLYKAGLDRAV